MLSILQSTDRAVAMASALARANSACRWAASAALSCAARCCCSCTDKTSAWGVPVGCAVKQRQPVENKKHLTMFISLSISRGCCAQTHRLCSVACAINGGELAQQVAALPQLGRGQVDIVQAAVEQRGILAGAGAAAGCSSGGRAQRRKPFLQLLCHQVQHARPGAKLHAEWPSVHKGPELPLQATSSQQQPCRRQLLAGRGRQVRVNSPCGPHSVRVQPSRAQGLH